MNDVGHRALASDVAAVVEAEKKVGHITTKIGCPKPVRKAGKSRKSTVKSKHPKSGGFGIKTTEADRWFGLCVRERSDWTCEVCGTHKEPEYSLETGLPKNQGLQTMHYIGRGNWSVRLYPDDADAGCSACHTRMDSNPHVFQEWKVAKLGQERYDILIEKSNDPMIGKEARHCQDEEVAHYKSEFERMRKLRAQGVMGRIEFQAWN